MKLKLIALALLASTSMASAADLGPRTYTKAPALAPVTNWSGFYVGVMGGYAWSDQVSVSGISTSSSDLKGGFGGGTIGYNWQVGPSWLFGLEVDAAGADIKFSDSDGLGSGGRDKINALGSVTGRVGYAVNSALFYVKGGYAWANNELSLTDGGVTRSDSKLNSGYTVGGGLEYMFAPAWSAKVEYMYADFGHQDYFNGIVSDLGATVHTVKGGINYHFNWGGPVVARY
jgi:outer membrane immunogenic protein